MAEAARTSIAATARRLGYSRTAVSLALAGKYPGGTDKLAAKVLAVLGGVACPQLGHDVTAAECADKAGAMPTSSPAALRLWRACQICPHRPGANTTTKHRSDAAGKEHTA
ncbi:Phage protein [Desulfovibrio sp. DV]|nr:Phage protein [Desulfovibrio sp. DV]